MLYPVGRCARPSLPGGRAGCRAEAPVCKVSGNVRAGLVRMDRARQDWVHEYAETGKPPYANDGDLSPSRQGAEIASCGIRKPGTPAWLVADRLDGTRRRFRQQTPDSDRADSPCTRWCWSSPAGKSGMVSAQMAGHTHSAIGSLQHSTRSACSFGNSPWFATLRPRAVWFASDRSSEYFSPSGPARLHPSLPRELK